MKKQIFFLDGNLVTRRILSAFTHLHFSGAKLFKMTSSSLKGNITTVTIISFFVILAIRSTRTS